VLFASPWDPADADVWSGLPSLMYECLRRAFPEVRSLVVSRSRAVRLESRLRGVLGSPVSSLHLVRQSHLYARQIAAELSRAPADIVFSPSSTVLSHFSAPGVRTAFYTDATFAGLSELYPWFRGLGAYGRNQAQAVERGALARCTHAFYASDWARDWALREDGANAEGMSVVPFGPNFAVLPSAESVATAIALRPAEPMRLLFVGKDFERKGGRLTLAIADALIDAGVPTELTMVGCDRPADEPRRAHVCWLGTLSKRHTEGRAALTELYLASHFLVVPTRADAAGVVFAEAAAFGVPSVATNVGEFHRWWPTARAACSCRSRRVHRRLQRASVRSGRSRIPTRGSRYPHGATTSMS
jgi:glycosyltransferase involved in cell wall biosynthesis